MTIAVVTRTVRGTYGSPGDPYTTKTQTGGQPR